MFPVRIFRDNFTGMFRHKGKSRTIVHNLKLASLLSFVAGIVNVAGFLAVNRLTTNVTGHFAFFADGVIEQQYAMAVIYLVFILSFLAGAFTSNFVMELVATRNLKYIYAIPVFLEAGILTFTAFAGPGALLLHADAIACALLFSMGLQNALVTSVSNAVVRTTHLTGLFTDLGIELSQLFFYRKKEQRKKLRASISLRGAIIGSFFTGSLAGGFGFFRWGIHILLLAAACLLAGLMYDTLKFRVVLLRRRYLQHS